MTRQGVTVLIPTFNSAAYLPDLIEDTRWADEVLVVDSYSTDQTVTICRERKIRVIQHEYVNSAKQKNWAIPQCSHEWVFLLDTDERMTPELQAEIVSLCEGGISTEVDAFRVARRTYFLGQWLTNMNLWPDYQTRLFRKSVGRYEEKEVHADVLVPGGIETLANPLDHYATPSLSKQIGLLDRYSTYQADELTKEGQRFSWVNILLRPIGAFVMLYLFKGGVRSGLRGLFISFHAMAFVFFVHAKLWEKEWKAGLRR